MKISKITLICVGALVLHCAKIDKENTSGGTTGNAATGDNGNGVSGVAGIATIFPANSATNVSTKAKVRIIFNTAMDAATLTLANVKLTQGGATVPATITYHSAGMTLLITPDADLAPDTTYSVEVTSGLKTAANEQLTAQTITFSTERVGMPTPNYQLGIIHKNAQVSFTTYTPGATIQIGTSSNVAATTPDSWHTVSTHTFTANGTVKLFARAEKAGQYSDVFAKVYTVQDAYPAAVGQPGTDAIKFDNAAILSWANGHLDYLPGTDVDASWKTPDKAYGPAQASSFDIVCLGNATYSGNTVTGGMVTLTFPKGIADKTGNDLAVFENSFSDTFLELGYVEVSSDGVNFVRFDTVSLTAAPVSAFGAVQPTAIYGFAGRYRVGYGTPFDLSDLRYKPEVLQGLVDLSQIRFVRIVDVLAGNATEPVVWQDFDSFGNRIYDPYKTTGSGGFDLDAVAVLNEAD
jgi:hypothetical protein